MNRISRRAFLITAAAAPLVADGRRALDADQRRDVAQLAHPPRGAIVDERAVGEHLEVAVAVAPQHRPEVGVHQRLAAQYAEEAPPAPLGLGDDRVQVARVH